MRRSCLTKTEVPSASWIALSCVAIALTVGAVTSHWRLWRTFAHRLGYINEYRFSSDTIVHYNLGVFSHHHSMIISFALLSGERVSQALASLACPAFRSKSETAGHTFTSLRFTATTLVVNLHQDQMDASRNGSHQIPTFPGKQPAAEYCNQSVGEI